MLVETTKNLSNKVVAIKLITGEEIIARAGTVELGDITIKNPLSMIMVPNEDSNQGMVAFAPWLLAAAENESIKILSSKYIVAVEATREAAEQYVRAVGEADESVVVQKAAPQILGGNRKGGRGR